MHVGRGWRQHALSQPVSLAPTEHRYLMPPYVVTSGNRLGFDQIDEVVSSVMSNGS